MAQQMSGCTGRMSGLLIELYNEMITMNELLPPEAGAQARDISRFA